MTEETGARSDHDFFTFLITRNDPGNIADLIRNAWGHWDMALDKTRTGIMAAISAAQVGKAPVHGRAHRRLPNGAVGSGGIEEIDTDLIEGWGPQDRLELTAVNSDGIEDLAASIATSGQQVPVLLRPSNERDGHFEVIYGRRRVLACIRLGLPVRALIHRLDDCEALKAKGLENAARSDLSYYERARFAEAILRQGYSRDDAMQALAISKNTLSQFERITRLIPTEIGDAIGAAPGAGRPKWMALAAAFEGGEEARMMADLEVRKALAALDERADAEARLDAVLAALSRRGANGSGQVTRSPAPGVSVKSGKSSVALSIRRTGKSRAFADWLDGRIDRLIEDAYRAFQAEQEAEPRLTLVNSSPEDTSGSGAERPGPGGGQA